MRALFLFFAVAGAACNSPDAIVAAGGGGGGAGGGDDGGGGSGGSALPGLSPLWAKRYAAPEEQRGVALDLGSSGVVVAASLNGSITLGTSELTSAGNADVLAFSLASADGSVGWSWIQGDAQLQEVLCLSVSRLNDELALGGSFAGYLWNNQSSAGADLWLARVNPDQTLRALVRRASNRALGATFDAANNTVMVGDFDTTFDTPDPDLVAAGGFDGLIVVFSPNGQIQRAARLGSTGDDALTAVVAEPNGRTHAVGFVGGAPEEEPGADHGGGKDIVLASYEADGSVRFIKLFGDDGDQSAEDITVDPGTGDLIVVGWFEGTLDVGGQPLESKGGRDAFVMRLNDAGQPLFAAAFGDAADQHARAVSIDGTGRIVVAGDFEGALSHSSGSLVSAGKTDLFVLRMSDSGAVEAEASFGDAESQYAEDLVVDDGDNVYLLASVQGTVDFGAGPLAAEDTSFDIAVAKFAP